MQSILEPNPCCTKFWWQTYIRQQDIVLTSLCFLVWSLTIVEHRLQPVQPTKLTVTGTSTYTLWQSLAKLTVTDTSTCIHWYAIHQTDGNTRTFTSISSNTASQTDYNRHIYIHQLYTSLEESSWTKIYATSFCSTSLEKKSLEIRLTLHVSVALVFRRKVSKQDVCNMSL